MELLHTFLNFILHLDQHMLSFFNDYGSWAYVILFLIIFCETAFVVTPFLPGDSLLFAAGALAAQPNTLQIHFLFLLLVSASILGNSLNYLIGKFIGPKVFRIENSWFFNPNYLHKANSFYKKHGPKTIIIARFIPIIRTFAPFLAGIGYMSPQKFTFYNVVGALLWIGSLLYISFLFGNLPFIKTHFSTIILGIIVISLLPPIIELLRHHIQKKTVSN